MSEMHEDAAAYALTALDGADLAEYEAHLATCEVCQREVAEFIETAAALSLLTQATPPPACGRTFSRSSRVCRSCRRKT